MAVKNIAILGSTGSIGINALEVIAANPQRFRVVALAAGGNARLLAEQARRFRPGAVALADEGGVAELTGLLAGQEGEEIAILSGRNGVIDCAAWDGVDMVVSAIVGGAGLEPTLAAVRAGKDIALANKECLVMAGALFMEEVARMGVRLIPVDSEHSAIFQVFESPQAADRLILTASGGPFRGWRRAQLEQVTPEQALAHPKWDMGPKISIDSATLMNKGLEVIEARWLFDMPAERIEVVIHPQSIVHSLVAYPDGSVLAQMGEPDMRTPIAVALAWPERIPAPVSALNLVAASPLDFYPVPDRADFPCLALAFDALRQGGAAPTVLNAANEVAVAAFLDGRIPFLGIPEVIDRTLGETPRGTPASIPEVIDVDYRARSLAGGWVDRLGMESLS